ncbi:hypothetical protein OSB04_017343 [Centaurea solstitialis]|uniref:S-protein homolog n=1 Tax=Centaurea solstitialis TaxID=347529 RepID=A0AA38TMQ2_9ASTR|nr:hypothetical protein OSB04_017343 [Centaurea solstitialis]
MGSTYSHNVEQKACAWMFFTISERAVSRKLKLIRYSRTLTLHIMSFTLTHRSLMIMLLIWDAYAFSMAANNHKGNTLLDKYDLHIINVEVGDLRVHCMSTDDDIGDKELTPGQFFHWSFRQSFLFTTHFTCVFRSMTSDGTEIKSVTFDVFDYYISILCGDQHESNNCYWLVKDDGFYFSKDSGSIPYEFSFEQKRYYKYRQIRPVDMHEIFKLRDYIEDAYRKVDDRPVSKILDQYEVHIIDGDVNNLDARCKSKDDDLGNQRMAPNQFFHWKFRQNIFQTTLFHCDFQWTTHHNQEVKNKSFIVFDFGVANICGNQDIINNCYWLVRADGFYISKTNKPFPTGWRFMYSWPSISKLQNWSLWFAKNNEFGP